MVKKGEKMKHLILVAILIMANASLYALEKSFECRTIERIDTTEIVNYLREGGDPNKCIILRKSLAGDIRLCPLSLAAQENDAFLAQLALKEGAEIDHKDNRDYTALSIAAKKGHIDMMRLLIKHGATVNLTDSHNSCVLALGEAIGVYKYDIVELLIKHGVMINAVKPGALSPLYVACCRGLESIATLLINEGADINYCPNNGERPLTVAISKRLTTIALKLINANADITYSESMEVNRREATPLEMACIKYDVEVVDALIAKKANVNSINKGCENKTPLHMADTEPKVVSSLIKAGADINAQDAYGETPLHDKVRMGYFAAVKILLANKADVNIKNKKGQTPLYSAATSNYIIPRDSRHEMIDLLLKAGAKVEFSDFEQKTLLNGSQPDDTITIRLLKNGLIPTAGFLELLDKTMKEKYHTVNRLADLKEIKQLCNNLKQGNNNEIK